MHRWIKIGDHKQKSFKCKFCDKEVASDKAYYRKESNWRIYICPNCARPTFFLGTIKGIVQIPAPLLGHNVDELPENTVPVVRSAIENAKKGINFGEIGLEE